MSRTVSLLVIAGITAFAVGCPAETKTKAKKRGGSSSSSSSSDDADWPGTFIGARLSITIEKAKADDDDAVKGTITQGAQTFPFTGTTSGDTLDGSFKAGDDSFELTATLNEDELSLETGGKTYALKRKKAANPLGGGEAPKKTNPLGGGGGETPGKPGGALSPDGMPAAGGGAQITPPTTTAGGDWKTFKNKGYLMRYPPDWRTQPAQDAVLLIPPNQSKNAQGQPTEVYIVRGVPSQGAKRADEPRATAYFEQQMRQYFPKLRRTAGPTKLPRGAISMRYAGTNPQTNQAVTARLYVIVIEGTALMFLALGDAAQVEKRSGAVAKIFGTFGYERPKNDDPRLVGAWRNTRTYMSGTFSSVTERYLLLTADGRCYGGGQFAASMEHKGPGGELRGTSSLGTGDKKGWEYSGRWFASNRSLTLDWSNGNREYYGYYICDGKSMLLRQSRAQKKGGLLFERYR